MCTRIVGRANKFDKKTLKTKPSISSASLGRRAVHMKCIHWRTAVTKE